MDAEIIARLSAAGLTAQDLAWFESFGWDDARVPALGPGDMPEFRRREAALNASVASLGYIEKGFSREGRLAAAIGARCADAEDRASGDDD